MFNSNVRLYIIKKTTVSTQSSISQLQVMYFVAALLKKSYSAFSELGNVN